MTPKTPELLPCPFCGGRPIHERFETSSIRCIECGMMSKNYWTEEKAIEAWNTHIPQPAQSAPVMPTREPEPHNKPQGYTEIVKIMEGGYHGDIEKVKKYAEKYLIKFPCGHFVTPFDAILNCKPSHLTQDVVIMGETFDENHNTQSAPSEPEQTKEVEP